MSFTATDHRTGTHAGRTTDHHTAGRTGGRTAAAAGTTEATDGGVRTVAELVDRFGDAPTVLAVWAHPDDESFLTGGLLAEIAHRGGRIVNVNATSGEHGTDDPATSPPHVLAARRERELRRALDELGVGPAIGLGFIDGGCHLVDDEIGARTVGRLVDRVRPDVIVTFGPDGVTGHPDHQAIARWTRRAVAERGDRLPLLTTAASDAWPAECIEGLHSIDAFWPGHPHPAASNPAVAVVLAEHLVERKLAALARHASQMERVEDALGAGRFRSLATIEAYRAGNPAAHRLLRRHDRHELTHPELTDHELTVPALVAA